ncbi:MAG: hemin transporter HemP [Planctomycetaceae bacterium]|nr:hemin transporter HemP [Planctomycetaceae bacterium]MBQ79784.1 hemin transporter HemP [Planctomycetaceae bacterium]
MFVNTFFDWQFMKTDLNQNQEMHEKVLKESLPRKSVSSEELLQGQRELQILHGNDVYRLTLTRTGKLILHK